LEVANWNWKAVRAFVLDRFAIRLRRSSCRTYLHRLGFVLKRPKKRLLKADPAKREAFVHAYVALQREATAKKAKIFFVDEAHFYADVDLHAKWVLKGAPAFVESTSPRWGEKASYYSAVCPETGEVDAMPLDGNSGGETSVAFLKRLRSRYPGPLIIIWDNGPAHGGAAVRAYLRTPRLRLRLVRLPAYSPDFNADEAIWRWIREEVTANVCFGTKARVRAHVDHFFSTIADRAEEAIQRCRTALQASADALTQSEHACSVDPIAV
jgi:transposase